MAVIEKTYVPDTSVIDSTGVVRSNYFMNAIQSFLYFVFAIIETLILLRIILVFFGANYVGFAQIIYDLSKPLVTPFFGIFNTTSLLNVPNFRLEWESILALIIYGLMFSLITYFLNMFRNRYY